MATKKKTAKKQAKRVNVGLNGPVGGGVLASVHQPVSLPEALTAFDAALTKVQGIRSVLVTSPNDGRPVNDEVLANRARRLADAVSNLQHAAWTLREAAFAEADK